MTMYLIQKESTDTLKCALTNLIWSTPAPVKGILSTQEIVSKFPKISFSPSIVNVPENFR